MNRKERHDQIIKALKENGFTWETLDSNNGVLIHIRVKNFGDVWPTSGTYKIGGHFYKKDYNGLIQRLTGKMPEKKKSKTDIQQEIINELLKRMEDLEVEVAYLRNHVLPDLS